MSTPKAAAEIQAARARQYRRKVEPLPVPEDRPVKAKADFTASELEALLARGIPQNRKTTLGPR